MASAVLPSQVELGGLPRGKAVAPKVVLCVVFHLEWEVLCCLSSRVGIPFMFERFSVFPLVRLKVLSMYSCTELCEQELRLVAIIALSAVHPTHQATWRLCEGTEKGTVYR